MAVPEVVVSLLGALPAAEARPARGPATWAPEMQVMRGARHVALKPALLGVLPGVVQHPQVPQVVGYWEVADCLGGAWVPLWGADQQ